MKSNQTKSIGTSMLRVRCWMSDVAVLATAASALADVHYVDVNSTNATPPYTNWTTAATSIQDAVNAAVAGDEIVLTNGIYDPIQVDKPLSIRSVNGPQSTIIDGGGSVRCAYLTNGATLCGFTLTNGFASARANQYPDTASAYGGGVSGGTLKNCILRNNGVQAYAGDSRTTAYAYGGGAYGCELINCTLSGNFALTDYVNSSGYAYVYAYGGGAYACTLLNCTLVANSAYAYAYSGSAQFAYSDGNGAYASALNNCIAWDNFTPCIRCFQHSDVSSCSVGSCYIGRTDTNGPLFIDETKGDLRLQSNSPCINAGNNAYAVGSTDLDGNPRMVGGTVDIGAYEFQSPVSMISYAWLQQFNLPINPSTDTADPDGDGVNNYHEWLAGTDPTNPLSSPARLTIIPSGTNVLLTWSTNAVGFALQSTTNLVSPVAWVSNSGPAVIAGQNTVTNPITGPHRFYRLIH